MITIPDRKDVLAAIHDREFPKKESKANRTSSAPALASDNDVIEKVIGGDSKWSRLWSGDTSAYPSDSEADLALCSRIAFFAGNDPGCIDRVFRQSSLTRDKWDREDYRTSTINTAIDGIRNFYDWDFRKNGKSTKTREIELPPIAPQSLRELRVAYPALRPVLIDGIIRRGETLNKISASKIGKTWMTYGMAISIATGRPWLDKFAIPEPRPVLMLDNECHAETIAHRIPKVIEAMGMCIADVDERIQIQSLRGKLMDLNRLRRYLSQFKRGHFGAVFIDAWYRTLPAGMDENDNGAMAAQYNLIDEAADELDASFILIHHSSKGNQANKATTDVGSGAGSMARAADGHVVFRHHEEPGAVVADAAVRSFAPLEPFCLRWDFPLWHLAPELNPEDLRQERRRKTKATGEEKPAKMTWTIDAFVQQFVKAEPQTKDVINITAKLADQDMSERQASKLLKAAVDVGKVHLWKSANPAEPHRFSTAPQPLIGGEK